MHLIANNFQARTWENILYILYILYIILFTMAMIFSIIPAWAQQKPLPGKQPHRDLSQAQIILIETTAVINGQWVSPQHLIKTITQRLHAIGYHTTHDATHAHDVRLTINCQEPNPDHGFDGPPCLFRYGVGGAVTTFRSC